MKNIKILLLVFFVISFTACKEDFLVEKPQDFFSTNNAFVDVNDFNASTNNLYAMVRTEFYSQNDFNPMEYLYRTDLVYQIVNGTANMEAEITPTAGMISNHWERLFKIITEANTMISRIPASKLIDSDKVLFEAKARFFRAFAYRALAYLYGGVPLITEEATTAKVDFVRASRKEIYTQIISDLTFSIQNLPTLALAKDGEASITAAQHLLAEVYIADGQFQKAVDAATAVINTANLGLMTARFGSRSTVAPGDVYWDLFQRNNQNRKSAGNKEAIWVMQFETDVIGGGSVSTGFGQSWQLERVHPPLFRDVQFMYDQAGKKNVSLFTWPASDYTGGRGVGFMAPSLWFIQNGYAAGDIRNANHNFVRAVRSTNNSPLNPYYGQMISFDNIPAGFSTANGGATLKSGVPDRAFYPYWSKSTTPGDHPAAVYQTPAPYVNALKTSAGATYTDQYIFRLAETYLLRAEAYLGLGQTGPAADDINVVRARSNASAITGAQVDIDFILDERMRELGTEEKRMLTLMRLGKLYDRLKSRNPYYGATVLPKHNLWPIPADQITRNRGAVLDQNPDY